MKNLVKYAILPVYTKDEKERVKLLYGYVFSKCYILEEKEDSYEVVFPYLPNGNTTKLPKAREPRFNEEGKCINTTNVNKVFNTFLEAKSECDLLNEKLFKTYSKANFFSTKQRISCIQNSIKEKTRDIKLVLTK